MRVIVTGSKSIYVLLLFYGASTATTTLACLADILALPAPTTRGTCNLLDTGLEPCLTCAQRMTLIALYGPFLLVPLIMAIDMAFRVHALVLKGVRTEELAKRQ
jgi:hypothetical protein